MKKFYLLLVLIPFLNFAGIRKGTVLMNDGSTKSGFIKLPGDFTSDLKFKLEEKGETEKLSINDVKEFEIITEEGEKIKYVSLLYASLKVFGEPEIKVKKEKYWFQVIREGKYSMLIMSLSSLPMTGMNGMSVPGSGGSELEFFLRKGSDDKAIRFDIVYGGLTFCLDCQKLRNRALTEIFKDDCPGLAEKITKDVIKKEGHLAILDIYEKDCGK